MHDKAINSSFLLQRSGVYATPEDFFPRGKQLLAAYSYASGAIFTKAFATLRRRKSIV
jgi:hypothetical protein